MTDELPWMELKEAARLFGLTVDGIKTQIAKSRFPLPTYKLGRRVVIDRQVVQMYFEQLHRDAVEQLAGRHKEQA